MQSLMSTSLSALGAFSVGMQVTANNIANMNTAEFNASRVQYETGPQGYGVRVGTITRDETSGPLIPAIPSEGSVYQAGETYMRPGSNVSIEREFVNMMTTEHAYGANAKVVQAYEDLTGIVVDMKV